MVVGAARAAVGGINQGAAYVFAAPASGWANMTQTQKLTGSDGASGDSFGSSVAFSGSALVVGASNFNHSAAYLFGSASLGLSQTSIPPDTISIPYNQTIAAVGGTGTVNLSVGKISGAIKGLSVTSNANGVTISGTPTATGTETFTVTAKSQGSTASATYSITVNPPLTLGPTALPQGTVGTAYFITTPSSGGTAGPNNAMGTMVVDGSVQNPIPGISLFPTLVPGGIFVDGTPTATGTETFTVTATDGVGYTTTGTFSLTVITTPTAWTENWSGYAVTAAPGTVTDVKGSWIVPAPQSPNVAGGYEASWVGMDGFNSSTVEQTGTMMYTNASGQATYSAWYEMYPNGSVPLSMTIHAGDHMSGEVQYIGSNQFTLTLTDVTTHATFSTTQTMASAQRSSAEWIAEAPGIPTLPLADFGTASFSAASATIGGTTGPIDNTAWGSGNPIAVTMVDGATESYPSSLVDTSGTSAFTATWAGGQSPANGPMELKSAARSSTTLRDAALASYFQTPQSQSDWLNDKNSPARTAVDLALLEMTR